MNKSRLAFTVLLAISFSGLAMGQQEETHRPPPPKVAQRQNNQKRRIKQGVKSGELTKGETRRLERQQTRIQKTKRTDRAENGGRLTPKDKTQLNRMQNRASRHIYRAKHNSKVKH